MRNRAGERREGHDENARTDGSFKLKAEYAREQEKHHHAAAGADEAAYEADTGAADDRLDELFFRRDRLHGFFCRHDRLDDEFYTEQECHDYREIAHRGRGDELGHPAADNGENEHAHHHDKTVFNIEIFVFAVGISRYGTCEDIGCERDTDGGVRFYIEKCHKHRCYDRGGAHAGKTRAESRTHARKKAYDDFHEIFHLFLSPFSFDFLIFSMFSVILRCRDSKMAFSVSERPQ